MGGWVGLVVFASLYDPQAEHQITTGLLDMAEPDRGLQHETLLRKLRQPLYRNRTLRRSGPGYVNSSKHSNNSICDQHCDGGHRPQSRLFTVTPETTIGASWLRDTATRNVARPRVHCRPSPTHPATERLAQPPIYFRRWLRCSCKRTGRRFSRSAHTSFRLSSRRHLQ